MSFNPAAKAFVPRASAAAFVPGGAAAAAPPVQVVAPSTAEPAAPAAAPSPTVAAVAQQMAAVSLTRAPAPAPVAPVVAAPAVAAAPVAVAAPVVAAPVSPAPVVAAPVKAAVDDDATGTRAWSSVCYPFWVPPISLCVRSVRGGRQGLEIRRRGCRSQEESGRRVQTARRARASQCRLHRPRRYASEAMRVPLPTPPLSLLSHSSHHAWTARPCGLVCRLTLARASGRCWQVHDVRQHFGVDGHG